VPAALHFAIDASYDKIKKKENGRRENFMINFDENNEVVTERECRAILVGLEAGESIEYSMSELERLAEAAGCEVAGKMVQSAERRNNATYIGSGKVRELAELAENMEADTIIFNEELSGMQIRNLEDEIGVRVIDRTILILDIFASRATSGEGKLQVELAQLQYRLPRLMGFGKALSRQGGGIGTRGPGEKKLETDRRHIERRIDDIKAEINRLTGTRSIQRARREKNEIPVAALVGYTNSGKSALMNRLLSLSEKEDKSVMEKDMLFATLDTAQRSIKLDSNHEFILIDTVGFVSKLPHSLVQAFKATLEEVNYADLLLHVTDASYDERDFHIDVTESVLKEIGAGSKERILVYNKVDLLDNDPETVNTLLRSDVCETVCVSAKRGDGIDGLLELIKEKLFADRVRAKLLIPYDKGEVVSRLCEKAAVFSTEYTESGTLIDAEMSAADAGRYREYML